MRKLAVLSILLVSFAVLPMIFAQDQVTVTAPEIYQRAGQEFQAQNYQKAISDYSLFILLNPTFSLAYYNRGMSYIQMNELEAALGDLTRALELPSPSPEFTSQVYRLRSAIYQEQNQTDNALADLDKAIETVPSEAESYLRRGQIYVSQERFPEALEDFNQGIQLAPDTTDLYELRGLVHQQLQNYDAATTDLTHAIELDPKNARLYGERATVYNQQEQFETALKDLNTAITLQPDSNGLYLQRGALHNQIGNQELAAADYLHWILGFAQDEKNNIDLRPGESLVVQMIEGQIYTLSFDGHAGQTINVSASARPEQNTDPLLVIVDPNRNPVAADDDSGGQYNAAIRNFTLKDDGVYLIVLGHAGGGTNGPVRVLLTLADEG
jgi:tetratricopeptide (TPR) repeat protein